MLQTLGTSFKGGHAADEERRLIERIKQGDEDALMEQELALLAELSQDLYILENDQEITREIELISELEST